MKDILIHGSLFLFVSMVIVAISCMFADSDDRLAARAFPRRLLGFIGGCLAVMLLMLLFEHTMASVH